MNDGARRFSHQRLVSGQPHLVTPAALRASSARRQLTGGDRESARVPIMLA